MSFSHPQSIQYPQWIALLKVNRLERLSLFMVRFYGKDTQKVSLSPLQKFQLLVPIEIKASPRLQDRKMKNYFIGCKKRTSAVKNCSKKRKRNSLKSIYDYVGQVEARIHCKKPNKPGTLTLEDFQCFEGKDLFCWAPFRNKNDIHGFIYLQFFSSTINNHSSCIQTSINYINHRICFPHSSTLHILSDVDMNYFSVIQQDIFIMSAPESLENIFREIDTNGDGIISRQDLEATQYALTLFDSNDNVLIGFSRLNDKMKEKDFVLLVNAYRLKLHEFAIAKFEIAHTLDKYLSVSAPGVASPNLKQSYLKFTAQTDKLAQEKLHYISLEFGVDKPQQQKKIEELEQVLGHKPHQVFLLLKFKANTNGQQIAEKLQKLLQEIQAFAQQLSPELEGFVKIFRVYARYGNGYVHLIVEIDNPFVDNLVSFFNEVVQAISPECLLKFKAKLGSNIQHLLKESFSYEKSGGEILAEFDIDYVTLKKIKEILGDNVVQQEQGTPPHQLLTLLFEEVKLSVEFNNLGEALQSVFQLNAVPTPFAQLAAIKEMNLKETLGQISQGSTGLIDELKSSCEAEGQLSLNFHDFFLKVAFDVEVEDAFDLL